MSDTMSSYIGRAASNIDSALNGFLFAIIICMSVSFLGTMIASFVALFVPLEKGVIHFKYFFGLLAAMSILFVLAVWVDEVAMGT
ncbi:hypothetical protein [Yoonia sp. 2307UL14-13]|uniref:hypothetical protein n=1 Tax=Yoonia sp. 2307UL14-13 TaxID=3126506 RepID=UPI0030A312E5